MSGGAEDDQPKCREGERAPGESSRRLVRWNLELALEVMIAQVSTAWVATEYGVVLAIADGLEGELKGGLLDPRRVLPPCSPVAESTTSDLVESDSAAWLSAVSCMRTAPGVSLNTLDVTMMTSYAVAGSRLCPNFVWSHPVS